MPRKRSSKRRSSPVAALVAIVVLGGAALALETYGTPQKESQAAAVIAQGTADTGATTPAGGTTQTSSPTGTETAECVAGVDYTVKLHDGKPKIHCTVKFQCPTQRFVSSGTSQNSNQNHGCDYVEPAPGVSIAQRPNYSQYSQNELLRCTSPLQDEVSKISYCLPGTLTAGKAEECKQVGTCRPGGTVRPNDVVSQNHSTFVQGQIAAAGGEHSFRAGEIEATNAQLMQGMPSSLSNSILGSFEQEPAPTGYSTLPADGGGVKTPPSDILLPERNPARDPSLNPMTSDMPVPPQNLGQTGTLLNCPGGPNCPNGTWNPQTQRLDQGVAVNCPGSPGCKGGTWDPQTQTLQQTPQQCSWWQIFCSNGNNGGGGGNGGGNLLGALFGGGQQQPQCGYVNGRYVCMPQQQCSPIQQIVSGCPNMFGQQQCGGLMLMLDRCPQGSYNPNNPSNPYNYPQPSCSIQVSPQNAQQGQPVTIQWQSQNAQYANISGMGQVGPSGSMTAYPQGPTTYVMNVVGYGNQQGQCQTQYGSGGTSGEPVAQISCQPLKADVGMQIAISYACQNASGSVGSGFSTGGALSGSSVVTVSAPTFGQHTVNYGLTCTNQGKTHSAQCTIDVNKAAIVLTTVPKSVQKGKEALIGWVTSGMESCTLTSGASTSTLATSTAGSFKTGSLNAGTEFGLSCTTKVGSTKVASTSVQVLD